MKRLLGLLMSCIGCTAIMIAAAPPASAADFDYEEDLPEITLPGVDLAAVRSCNSSLKTTIVLLYRASTDTYYQSVKGTGKSTCSNERLALALSVSDEAPLMPTYSTNTGAVGIGSVTTTAAQTVPARLVTQVTFQWNFVPQYGVSQCFQKTYTVVKGTAPRAGDTKPCGSLAVSPEGSEA